MFKPKAESLATAYINWFYKNKYAN